MKKLKKSLNKKPVVVFIYGPIAAGKFTIAKELSKKIGYKVFHNHMTIDFAKELIPDDKIKRSIFRQELYFNAIVSLMKLNISTIFTHAYADNFVFPAGITDPEYLKKTERTVVKNGGVFYGVQLICDEGELLKRLKQDSRKKHGKLKNSKIMKKLLKEYDHLTSAPINNNFIIDNTNLPPKKVADMVIKHFNLK